MCVYNIYIEFYITTLKFSHFLKNGREKAIKEKNRKSSEKTENEGGKKTLKEQSRRIKSKLGKMLM